MLEELTMDRITQAALILAFGSLLACGSEPSSTNGPYGSGGVGSGAAGGAGGAGAGTGTGCTTAPNCGGCQLCFDQCYCQTGNVDQCVNTCSGAGGSGVGGSGQGGSGVGGSGVGGSGQGGSGQGGSGQGGSGQGGSGQGGSGQGGSGQGGTGGVGGDAGTGGTGGTGLPPGTQLATIKTTPFTLGPGEERFKCQTFANPIPTDAAIVKSESFMTPGSHHMFVFYADGATNGPLVDCNGAEFAPYLHLAQTPQEAFIYPPGVGRRLNKSQGMRVLMHYLNTGTAPLQAEVRFDMHWVPPDQIQQLASTFFFNNVAGINVLPHSPGTATMTCNIPSDIKIISAVSHMHKHATHFKATTGSGEVLYEGTDWDEPEPRQFDPGFPIPRNTKITHVCDFQNDTSTVLRFGNSAITNEMCIFQGTFYPSATGQMLTCNGGGF